MITFEFHVSKKARDKYKIEKSLFSIQGDLIIANFQQARLVANKINEERKSEGLHDKLVTAGQLNGLGLMHEIFHYLIRLYEKNENPGVFARKIKFLENSLGVDHLNQLMIEYLLEFPPLSVYSGETSLNEYLSGYSDGKSNKEIILEELMLLNIENNNPATTLFQELYNDKPLASRSKYVKSIDFSEKFFINEKPFGPENLPLLEFLRKPIINNPYDLEGQLEYIREKWGVYIYEKFNDRLLKGKDLIQEDIKLFLQHGGGEKATPPVPVYKYDAEYFTKLREKIARGESLTQEENQFYYAEVERFTEDVDWMPKVVMIAKNAFVWLDQLSKKYQRSITKLDQIPDSELDDLANWNFTSLWLIGLWERSSASKKIKQLTGNPEAAASAYSLFDYVIANDLGGEEAFENLKSRAWARGIRLASDMVPNHTGIYSKWVVEKPDYFIQRNDLPYPSYTFNGPNLSDDSRVEVRIEDKYYSKTDASVVFERLDKHTGDKRYIYHGNDGTNMPWNDTAQLNLLNPEVRETLIQTIMHVARKTPIIRFDAAMTLTKKHYQRLWFPHPGTGGAIPSRSDYSLSRSQFDEAMPEEFWREVVDRINKELPHTLLLAEAFWLMEGYFVRTLGMHRVYNSAFMHMFMKEENSKYRELIKNTLDFNPEILKRYVNFMSNPDEETAVNQFGKGDKYFGVSAVMVTLPGLPMFGHGQVEGFSEKYGMEYQKAYYTEFTDEYLVIRHEEEIFPLMRKRYLFSQVNDFELYDFLDSHGNVNENVFAYTNKYGSEKALVVYNNSFNECSGIVNYSTPKTVSNGDSTENKAPQKIAQILDIKGYSHFYYIFKEHKSDLEYLLKGSDLHDDGLYFYLSGYQYKIFMNITEVYDVSGSYEKLYANIKGKAVYSVEYELHQLRLQPLHNSFIDLFSRTKIQELLEFTTTQDKSVKEVSEIPISIHNAISKVVDEFQNLEKIKLVTENIKTEFKTDLDSIRLN